MNRKQLTILWVAIVLLVVTWGYPNWINPYSNTIADNSRWQHWTEDIGYSTFWKSPHYSPGVPKSTYLPYPYYLGRINYERSGIQSLIILLIFAGLFVTFKDKK